MQQNDRNVLFELLETNDVILKFIQQNQFQIFSNRYLDRQHDAH